MKRLRPFHAPLRRSPTWLLLAAVLSSCATPSTETDPLFRDQRYLPSTPDTALLSTVPVPPATPASPSKVIRPTSAPAPARHSRAPSTEDTQETVELNFQNQDIEAVVRAVSRYLQRQFLLDPRVSGQITLVSDGPVSPTTASQLLNTALRMQGFAIVDVGDVSRVVPVADAKLQGGGVDEAQPGAGITTRTFRLAYESAESLLAVLKPMIATENSIAAYPANNTLVITDYADNLDRLARIIESIDTPTSLDTEVVKVYNGVAVDIASLANELLQQSSGREAQRDILLTADPRSNNVLIRSSSPARTKLARELVIKLDNAQDDPANLHVVYLRNAQAGYLAQVLRGLLTGDSGEVALGSDDSASNTLGAGGLSSGSGTQSSNTNQTSSSSSGLQKSTGSHRFQGQNSDSGNSSFSANGVTVQADSSTNTLIIAAPEPIYRSLRRVIDLLDQRRAQVLVESLIVEVVEENAAELGIQWMRQGGNFIGGSNLGGAGFNTRAGNSIDLLPRGLSLGILKGSVNIPGVGAIMNLELLARALQSTGGVNILSTPNILTLDNESASIMVGKTVPFVSGQYITSGSGGSDNPFQTVQREDIGLRLQIRPQISEGGTVKLDIYQEVSSIDDKNSGLAGIVTNKRAIDTSVLLDDGQIMVLGGLLEDKVQTNNDSVPLLGDIPILGNLFRYERRERVKTNLMVFLRPFVIRDAQASRGITQDRYNFMRAAQSQAQPSSHLLLPDMDAPILPPRLPSSARRANHDLRDAQWAQTQHQIGPSTVHQSTSYDVPASTIDPPASTRSNLPRNVALASDSTNIYAEAQQNKHIVQFADVSDEAQARRIIQRVRISGLPAYIVSAPGGNGYALRVDLPRDAQALDNSIGVLQELGYRPELLIQPGV